MTILAITSAISGDIVRRTFQCQLTKKSMRGFSKGIRTVTHLFNAMSPSASPRYRPSWRRLSFQRLCQHHCRWRACRLADPPHQQTNDGRTGSSSSPMLYRKTFPERICISVRMTAILYLMELCPAPASPCLMLSATAFATRALN